MYTLTLTNNEVREALQLATLFAEIEEAQQEFLLQEELDITFITTNTKEV